MILGRHPGRAAVRLGVLASLLTALVVSVASTDASRDMQRCQSLIVWAINEGRGAARECDRYLMGESELP